jgi:hypothetical protein
MTINDITVYIDLDGVMADFEGALQSRFGFTFNTAPKGRVWGNIQLFNDTVSPWFYSLPLMEDAMELWDFCTANFDRVEILSASGTTPKDAAGQKKAWVGDNLGYDVKVHVVTGSAEKAAFANANAVLIDDRTRSITPFVAAGGIGILHTSAATSIIELTAMMKDWE